VQAQRPDMALFVLRQSQLSYDIAAFIVDRQARGLRPNTIRFYTIELDRLRGFLQEVGVQRVKDVTATQLRQYPLRLAEQGHNPRGVHRAYRAAKTFLRWIWTETEIEGPNPISRVTAPKLPEEILEPVPLSDIRSMLANCEARTFLGDRERAVLMALLDTGCRASEFVALDVQDLDLSTGAAAVRSGKGSKFRVVFMRTKTRREVVRYRRRVRLTNGPLWMTIHGTRLTYGGLRQLVRRRPEKAGHPTPSLHSFRRTFALYALRNGADIYSVQRLMGHSDLTMLRRYLKQTETDLREAHRTSGPVDNLL
jgi:site-specific recombinase XerD